MLTIFPEHLHRFGAAIGLTLMLLAYQNLLVANSSRSPELPTQLENLLGLSEANSQSR
jgi:hypothetical protein